jgi:twitching motility protein PilT
LVISNKQQTTNSKQLVIKGDSVMELMIEDLMEQLIEMGGSDMHIQAGAPVYFRISGKLQPIGEDPLTPQECQKLIFSMLNNTQRKDLEQTWELDCSYGVKGLARFRVNVYKERGYYAACLRALSSKIPNFDQLNLPDIVREMSERPRGLVLVTGPTGSGKTTTMAAMIDLINRTRPEHILTIEDPIEYVFPNIKSLIHQRQKGEDTKSFANALKAALREDPDVILVGEMRDLETISLSDGYPAYQLSCFDSEPDARCVPTRTTSSSPSSAV